MLTHHYRTDDAAHEGCYIYNYLLRRSVKLLSALQDVSYLGGYPNSAARLKVPAAQDTYGSA
jgi:hypothetical protein